MVSALHEAQQAAIIGEVPVGAVIVTADGSVLASAHNRVVTDCDPSAHAEIIALRRAATARGSTYLDDCTMVVTLEPCVMCAGAILSARLRRIVFGAWEEKTGACGSVYDIVRDGYLPQRCDVIGGVQADAARNLLQQFFNKRRC